MNQSNSLDLENTLLSLLDGSQVPRLSKIVCTISSSNSTVQMIEDMIKAGMDIARLNLGYGEHEDHLKTIENIRKAVKNIQSKSETHIDVAIAVDTKGPEIRIGMLEGGPNSEVTLVEGNSIRLTNDRAFINKGNSSMVFIDYEDILEIASPGMKIHISSVILILDWVEENDIVFTIVQGGMLKSGDKVTGEGIFELTSELSAKDLSDIEMAIHEHVDCLFLSYTMSQESIMKVKHLIKDSGGDMLVFAKIQNKSGLRKIKEILKAADGLMVCRRHLEYEIPTEKVFSCEKMVLTRCKEAGKPCICSNNLLLSMVNEPIASNAECFDIGNSVLDGVDCIVLSRATSVGNYPLDSIQFLANMCKEAEAGVNHKLLFEAVSKLNVDSLHSVAFTAVTSAFKTNAHAIIVISTSGTTAKSMSIYHPPCPIVAISRKSIDSRRLCFYRAVFPVYYKKPIGNDWEEDIQERWKFGVEYCKRMKFVESGSTVVVVTGWQIGTSHTDTMKIVIVD